MGPFWVQQKDILVTVGLIKYLFGANRPFWFGKWPIFITLEEFF